MKHAVTQKKNLYSNLFGEEYSIYLSKSEVEKKLSSFEDIWNIFL